MRSLLLILLLASPAVADPIRYTIHFTATEGITPTGSFFYDADSHRFTNFLVDWANTTFNFAIPSGFIPPRAGDANNPRIWGQTPCLAGKTAQMAAFALLSGDCRDAPGWRTYWFITYGASQPYMNIRSADFVGVGGVELETFYGVGPPFFPYSTGEWTISEDQPETFGDPAEEPAQLRETGSLWLLLSGLALMACQYGYVRRR